MGAFYWIIGIALGIALGIGLALRIVVSLIMRSNDIGDYSGSSRDFGNGLYVLEQKNGLSARKVRKRLEEGRITLEGLRSKRGLGQRTGGR